MTHDEFVELCRPIVEKDIRYYCSFHEKYLDDSDIDDFVADGLLRLVESRVVEEHPRAFVRVLAKNSFQNSLKKMRDYRGKYHSNTRSLRDHHDFSNFNHLENVYNSDDSCIPMSLDMEPEELALLSEYIYREPKDQWRRACLRKQVLLFLQEFGVYDGERKIKRYSARASGSAGVSNTPE